MYEQVQPRATKQITVRVDYNTVINQLLIRSDTFLVFDVLCRGKKAIPRSGWKQDRDGCFGMDIPEQTIKPGKPIQLSVRNLTDQPQLFDGWFSKKTVGNSIAVDDGWQVYEQPGVVIVNQRAVNNNNWTVQPMNNPQAGIFYWDYKYPAPIQDPYVEQASVIQRNYPIQETLSGTALTAWANGYGTGRLPEETDDELTTRLKRIAAQPNWVYQPYIPMHVSTWTDLNRSVSDIKVEQDANDRGQYNIKFSYQPQYPVKWLNEGVYNKQAEQQKIIDETARHLKENTKQYIGEPITSQTKEKITQTISNTLKSAFKSFIK